MTSRGGSISLVGYDTSSGYVKFKNNNKSLDSIKQFWAVLGVLL